MCRIKSVGVSARPLKPFEYICQQQHVRSEIEIVLVSRVLTSNGRPYVFCVVVVFVGAVFVQHAVESSFWSCGLVESCPVVHVLIGIAPFAE